LTCAPWRRRRTRCASKVSTSGDCASGWARTSCCLSSPTGRAGGGTHRGTHRHHAPRHRTTYADKAARIGLRIADLLDPDRFRARLWRALEQRNALFQRVYETEPLDLEALAAEWLHYGARWRDHFTDVPALLQDALAAGKSILMEGAQGTLLDLDYGTYPYVTSSHPVAAGACLGTGIPPRCLDEVWGVAKAYTTRVGEGPFPTELADEQGDYIRERGREYGTTTGRARRCGWLDLVALRYAARLNGFTALAITLLDVLSGLPTLRVCVAYRLDGAYTERFVADGFTLARCEAYL
jgi:adenylosuccinate synthase